MPTCRSWRYNVSSGDVETPPGKDRGVWSLCHNKVPRGVRRCEECLDALLFHPNPQIREKLAEERNVPRSTLEYLAESDPSMVVIAAAEKALAKLDKSPRRSQRAEEPPRRKSREQRLSTPWSDETDALGVNALGERIEGDEPEAMVPRADAFDAVLEQPEPSKRRRRRE